MPRCNLFEHPRLGLIIEEDLPDVFRYKANRRGGRGRKVWLCFDIGAGGANTPYSKKAVVFNVPLWRAEEEGKDDEKSNGKYGK